MKNMLDYISISSLCRKFQVDELLFVEFKCPYDESKSSIWWNNNFFAYVLAGETLLKTPHGEHILKPGDCIFARKGSVITVSQTKEDFCELLIFVPDDFIKNVIHKYKIPLSKGKADHPNNTIIPLETSDVLVNYFQSLLSYFSLPDPPPGALLKLKFEELIVNLSSTGRQKLLNEYFSELCARTKPSIREIMDANFASNLSLSEYAILCARSLSGFKREFVEIYHIPPGKWLIQKRLEYGRYLLETTDLSVDEVSFECGFENRTHFSRVFKSRYGVTPGSVHGFKNTFSSKPGS